MGLIIWREEKWEKHFSESIFFPSIKLGASGKFSLFFFFLIFELPEWEKVSFQYSFYSHSSSEDYSEQLK